MINELALSSSGILVNLYLSHFTDFQKIDSVKDCFLLNFLDFCVRKVETRGESGLVFLRFNSFRLLLEPISGKNIDFYS